MWLPPQERVAVVLVGGLLTASSGLVWAQSGVPDHYPGLVTYAEGEILQVLSNGQGLLLYSKTSQADIPGLSELDPREPTDDRSLAALDPEAARRVLVNLRKAKGWVFVDDPEGGEQRKVRLADGGRQLFEPGQHVQIGPAPGLTGEASEGSVSTQARGGPAGMSSTAVARAVNVSGWTYIRINRGPTGHRDPSED